MNSKIKFNIAYIKLCTKTEGPFKRCAIWFQGCNLGCSGCCNTDLQPLLPKHIVSLEELVNIVKEAKVKYNIEGITLTGGEPTLQKSLVLFNKEIKKLDLGIIMFSGKKQDDIDTNLINSLDLLIDGPFIKSKIDTERILIGSTNKNLTFITNRYKSNIDYFYNKISVEEVTVDDYIFINGD